MSHLIKHTACWLVALALVSVWSSPGWAQSSGKLPRISRLESEAAAEDEPPVRARPKTKKIQPVAGEDDASSPPPKKARPQPQELRVEPVSPELQKVLENWEKESSKILWLSGDHERIQYDNTFFVESRSSGRFVYEAPDKGRYEFEGAKISKDDVSKKQGPDKKPYKLQAGPSERWICTGKEVIKINDVDKTFDVVEIPEDQRGEKIMEGPLPFLFGMKAEQAKKRYQLQLLNKPDDSRIWIYVVPRFDQDKRNYREATIILDPKSFHPIAVRMIDPRGAEETVHKFKNVRDTKPIFNLGSDPFKFNSRGYQKIVVKDAGESDESQLPRVANQRPPVAQSKTAKSVDGAAKPGVGTGSAKKPKASTKTQ